MKGLSLKARILIATVVATAPLVSLIACGGSSDESIGASQVDAASADVVLVDTSIWSDGANDAEILDGSRVDANVPDAAKIQNRCGGYSILELEGQLVTPGDSCGGCNDGTIACIGSNVVECSGASTPPCGDAGSLVVDAGQNACGGSGPLTYLSADASVNDSCGDCGFLECGTQTTLICAQEPNRCPVDAGIAATCSIPDSAFTLSPTVPTLPAETRPTAASVTDIALPFYGLAYNPYDGFLYASVSGTVSQGNSIAVIDPTSATIITTIYVGPNPTALAISDDGQVLWTAVSTPPQIRRVDLGTRTVGTSVLLPQSTNTIYDIQILAGSHDSVMVSSVQYPGGGSLVVIYDGPVPRQYGLLTTALSFVGTPSPSLFYWNEFYSVGRACADARGAFPQTFEVEDEGDEYYPYKPTTVFSGGTIYTADGHGYDGKSGAVLNDFNITSYYPYNTPPAVDLSQDVYYLVRDNDTQWVDMNTYDRASSALTGSEIVQQRESTPLGFIRWGRYGFAYLDGYQDMVIARSAIIPDSP